jgi:hypothetical protein
MKKIFVALTVILSALALTGCEKMLDIQKKGVISMESFYQTDADAESALVNVYYQAARWLSNTMGTEAGWNECPLLNPFEYASDDMFAAGENKADGVEGNQINAFWYNDSNSVITGSYHCYYIIINAANQVIDHFAESADSQVKKRCVAEARVIRAYMHLILAMGWYNPPIVDHVYSADEKDQLVNAKDQNAILDFIIADCAAALNDLDEKPSLKDKDGAVKVTKGFCNAISGKAKMFKGDYSGAKTDLKKVIDSGKYDLVPSDQMSSLYHYSGRGNEESVLEFNLKYDATVDGYYQRAQPNFKMLWGWRASRVRLPDGKDSELPGEGPWGWCNPSAKFVNTILENDGYDSARRKAWIKSYDEVLYEMPYTSDKEGMTLADKKKDSYRGVQDASGLYGHVGYFMWKRLYRAEDRTPTAEIQWNLVIMRYAEVLLMYAECCAQTGDNSGLTYLNKVQERAQAKHRSSSLTLAEVQKEKYLECWLEGSRFPDLVRWGIADKELADNGKYLPNWCDAMSSKGEAEHRGYIDESDADWCVKAHPEMGFKKEKHSYFPIPFDNKNVNPNVHDWNATATAQ